MNKGEGEILSIETTIKDVLQNFDTLAHKYFDEHDISSALRPLIPEDRSSIDEHLKAELMAFDFVEDYLNQNTGWGTYFGPMIVWNNEDGTLTESPSIQLITPEMIDYWEKRANESTNPILKARYAGLVWDFKNKITGNNPNHKICRQYINALIEIANGDFYKYEVNTFVKLKRALSLAISLNDNDLINQVKDSIINFEERHSVDTKPGLWGYSFDLLIENKNKRVNLSEAEEQKIISELEAKLSRLTTFDTEGQKTNPWAAEAAAERLANYYQRKHRNEDVRRVLLEIGKAFDEIIGDATAMQATAWLDHLYKLYKRFNLKDADVLLLRIRELGPKVSSELKPISHSFEIPREEMEKYISQMMKGDIKKALFRIAIQYIPIKKQVKEQIFDLSKKAPLTFLITQQVQDEKGRVVATIDSLEQDLEGHVVRQISQNLSFSSVFLRAVLNELVDNKGLNKSDILAFLESTPIISKDRFEIIETGLDAYFENNYLVFIHLVIPQIEEAIRNIVEYTGGNVLKPSRGGGYHLRTFDEILRDELVKSSLGDDFADYFRILFTDQRGWNLRNNVCHGMATPAMFNQQTADRVLHALICIGLIHEKKNT